MVMDLGELVKLESVEDITVKKAGGKKRHIQITLSKPGYAVGAFADISKYLQKVNVVIDSMWYEKGKMGLFYHDYQRD
jgi:hypothetical protein